MGYSFSVRSVFQSNLTVNALTKGFRADIIVERKVILELKSIEKLHPVHKKQLLTYLKLTGMKLGFVLNFGEELMKTGIERLINGRLE